MIKKITISKKVFLLKVFIHSAAFIPLLDIYLRAFDDKLGADPVQVVIHFTGIGAFNLLLITLMVSPLAKRFKQGYLLQVRRLLGLYAFSYAFLHVINFLAFDLQFAWSLFLNEVVKRPYISIGMVAFVLLLALAITSISPIKRKMRKSWQKLHNFSYLVVILVSIHFFWSVKSELTSPMFYCALTILILMFRYKKLKALILTMFTDKNLSV